MTIDSRYRVGECKMGELYQAEGVAQSRYIANHGAGLTGSEHWELEALRRSGKPGRIDYMSYDPNDLSSLVELVELKVGKLGLAAERHAFAQVSSYARLFPNPGNHLVRAKIFTTPYVDAFSIERACDQTSNTKQVRYYNVQSSSTLAGVVMVTQTSEMLEPCQGSPTPLPTATSTPTTTATPTAEPTSSPTGIPVPVGPVKVDVKDIEDEFHDWLDQQPELVAELAAQVAASSARETARAMSAFVAAAAQALQVAQAAQEVAAKVASYIAALAELGQWYPKMPVWGDPHFATLDGLSYDLQGAGEFTLLEAPERDISVQMRTAKISGTASVTDRIATQVGEYQVELTGSGVLIDGAATALADGEGVVLGDNGLVRRSGGQYFIHWLWEDAGELDVVTVGFADGRVLVDVPKDVETSGLVGNNDGNPQNDLRLSDGAQLPAASTPQTLHGSFADSWRISDEESFFSYAAGETTATFTDRAFPENLVTIADFPAAAVEVATDRCRQAGVASGPQFNDCVYDILVTGDDSWAQVAATVTDDLIDPHDKGFVNGVLSEDFTSPVATNFAAARYLNDPDTSRVAGPFFDDTPYSFYLTDVGRHDQLNMTARLVAYGNVDGDASIQQVRTTIDGRTLEPLALEGAGSTTTDGSSTFVRAGTTAQGEPFRVYDISIPLQHFGDALKVKLTPVNFRGLIDTAMGVNNMTLALQTAPANDFAVTLPATVALNAPGAGAGNIETPGAEDNYTFALAAKADLGIFRTSGDPVKVMLLGDDGTRVQASESTGQFSRFNDLPTGNYAVRVRGEGRPASYTLAVNTIPADPTVAYRVGDPAVTVTTVAAGQNAHVTFSGQRGQRIQMRTTDASYSGGGMRWHVTAPGGTNSLAWPNSLIGSAANELQDTWRLPADGTYTATFDPEGIAAGSVRFRAWSVSDDVTEGYALDSPAKLVTTTTGQNAMLTFEGQAGQRIFMQTSEASYTGGGMRWQVTAPDGTNSLEWPNSLIGSAANALHEVWTLPVDGTYAVRIDPEGEAAGSVRFRAWTVPVGDVLATYVLDDPAATVTTASGQNATMTFQGRAGQRIQMQTTDASYTEGGMRWQVTAPDGSNSLPWPNSLIGSAANELQDTWRLPATGTYTVTFDPGGTATGSVKFKAWTVPDDVELTYSLDNPAATVSTTGAGQNAKMTFQGTQGQRIQMQTTDAAYTEGGMRWQVTAPDGSNSLPWPNSLIGSAANELQDTWRLPATGTYTVTFDPGGTATGSVKFRAWTVPDDVELTYALNNPATTVSTTGAGQNAKLTFQGTQGQRVQMQTTDASYTEGGMRWQVTAPDGSSALPWPQSLSGLGANELLDTWTVPATGTYTATFDPGGTATGSVKFRAWSVPDDVELTYALNNPAATVGTTTGQNAKLTFQGTQGQRIQMQTTDAAYTEGGMRWQVTAPDGSNSLPWPQSLSGHGANELQDTWTLPATGTYTVTFDPGGTATGSVKFRAWTMPVDLGALVLGGPAATANNLTAEQDGAWTINGQAGQRIAVETSSSTYETIAWKLLDSASVVLAQGTGNGWTGVVTLPSTGTYRFLIDPAGTQIGTITARAWTVGADVDSGMVTLNGTKVAMTVATPGRNATARFTAAAGQKVSLMTSENTYAGVDWKVLNPSGAVVASGSGNAFVEPITTVAGTYQVLVDPTGTATGTLSVQAWAVPTDVAAGALTSGTAKAVAIGTPGQNGRATIVGTVGQRIALQSAGSTYATMAWGLLDPTGATVASGSGNAFQDVLTLAKAGTYTVLVDPAKAATGSVSMTAWTVPADLNGGTLTLGTAKTVTVSNVAQDAYVTFTGTANQRLAMETSASTLAGVDWKLVSPSGAQLAAGSGNAFQDVTVLPVAGTYKILINPRGNATGRLSVKAWTVPADLNAGAATKGGAAVKLTLSTASQNGYVTYAGTAAQTVTFATVAGTLTTVSWRLLKPDGTTLVTGTGTSSNTGVVSLPTTGTYKFVVDPTGAGTGTINVKAS